MAACDCCTVVSERRFKCGRYSLAPEISGETEKVQMVSWLGKVQRCEEQAQSQPCEKVF